jgi:beta-lactam-binding protein with PASTA domain
MTLTLPDTMGKSKDDAEATLHAAGVRDVKIDNDPGSVDFATAKVCSQVPGAGQQMASTLFVAIRFCDNKRAPEKYTTKLVGLAVEDAKKRAQAAGFTGRIEVVEITNDPACKIGTVCSVHPERWELNQDHVMTLYVAKQLTISAPD